MNSQSLFRVSSLVLRISGQRPAFGFVLHNWLTDAKALRSKGPKVLLNGYVPVCLTCGINSHFGPVFETGFCRFL